MILGERKEIIIPKKIWLFWDGEMPLIVSDCLEKVKVIHSDYEVYILNKEMERMINAAPKQYLWGYKRFRKIEGDKIGRAHV